MYIYMLLFIFSALLACPRGKYGLYCKLDCECRGSSCNPETGNCVCKAGKRGKHCKHSELPLTTILTNKSVSKCFLVNYSYID